MDDAGSMEDLYSCDNLFGEFEEVLKMIKAWVDVIIQGLAGIIHIYLFRIFKDFMLFPPIS